MSWQACTRIENYDNTLWACLPPAPHESSPFHATLGDGKHPAQMGTNPQILIYYSRVSPVLSPSAEQ